jgi:hypothetical protein
VHYRFKPKSSYPVKFSGEPSDTQEVTIALKKEFLPLGTFASSTNGLFR